MGLQFSVPVRNAQLDVIESTTGVSAVLKFRTGSAPASCATADSGTVIATLNLPADWMAAAASGAKAKSGTWEDTQADAAGAIGHFRIYASDGTTCHIQGAVTASGGGGQIELLNATLALGQDVIITALNWTAGNA